MSGVEIKRMNDNKNWVYVVYEYFWEGRSIIASLILDRKWFGRRTISQYLSRVHNKSIQIFYITFIDDSFTDTQEKRLNLWLALDKIHRIKHIKKEDPMPGI